MDIANLVILSILFLMKHFLHMNMICFLYYKSYF